MTTYEEIGFVEKRVGGAAAIMIGIERYFATSIRATARDHYSKSDKAKLDLAKGEIQTGLGLLIGSRELYSEGIANMDNSGVRR